MITREIILVEELSVAEGFFCEKFQLAKYRNRFYLKNIGGRN